MTPIGNDLEGDRDEEAEISATKYRQRKKERGRETRNLAGMPDILRLMLIADLLIRPDQSRSQRRAE